jgi:TPR repeat protein
MRRLRTLTGLCIAVAVLSSCGGGAREAGLIGGRADDRQAAIRPGRDPNAAYIKATELKAAGDCTAAAALLTPVAALGPGYENAQQLLGECLIDLGRHEEGLTWLTRAADAGWPEAQASLVIHLGGGTPARNREEAAYWLALFDVNPGKARIGFRAPDMKALGAVRESLSPAEWAAGQRRAAAWQRKLWLPPPDVQTDGLEVDPRDRGEARPPRPL